MSFQDLSSLYGISECVDRLNINFCNTFKSGFMTSPFPYIFISATRTKRCKRTRTECGSSSVMASSASTTIARPSVRPLLCWRMRIICCFICAGVAVKPPTIQSLGHSVSKVFLKYYFSTFFRPYKKPVACFAPSV